MQICLQTFHFQFYNVLVFVDQKSGLFGLFTDHQIGNIAFLNDTVDSVEIERRKVDKLYITHTLCILSRIVYQNYNFQIFLEIILLTYQK